MNLRKWLSLMLCVMCALCFLTQAAAENGTAGTLTWTLENGVLTVTGTGTFPAKGPWMTYAKKIKSIEIGDGIDSIANRAFDGFPALTYIHYGAGLNGAGWPDFGDVPKLKSVHFSGPVDRMAFSVRLEEVVIDENPDATMIVRGNYVTSTAGSPYCVYAIGNMKGTVEVPQDFDRIAMYAFYGMKNMKDVVLPAKLTGIYNFAFANCTGLKSITLPPKLATLSKSVFSGCKALKQVIFLGEKVSLDETFAGCTGLREIVLPAVDTLKTGAFRDCVSLKTVVVGEGTKEIGKDIFPGCGKLADVYLPASVTAIDGEAFDPSLKKLVFHCVEGSFAESYLRDHGLKYVTYRPVESITLDTESLSLDKGKNASLKAALLPANASLSSPVWASSNEQVATVKNGRVKAVHGGECDVYCMAGDGSGIRAVCHVTVLEKIKSLKAAEKKHTMAVGDTWEPVVKIDPESASNKILVWNSSDESVCSVSEAGVVTALGAGKCVITCEATDGSKKSVKINVTVTAP